MKKFKEFLNENIVNKIDTHPRQGIKKHLEMYHREHENIKGMKDAGLNHVHIERALNAVHMNLDNDLKAGKLNNKEHKELKTKFGKIK